jgi:hypothetical protein
MSKRLNTWMREQIVANALEKSGLNQQMEQYKADRAAWANAVADESMGGSQAMALILDTEKKAVKLMEKIKGQVPEGALRTPYIAVRVGDIMANIAGCKVYVSEWEGKRPARDVTLTADHPMAIQFFDLENRKSDLSEKRRTLKANVKAAVDSVSTVSALLKAWPEAVELLPNDVAPAPQLPAVQAADLNKLIGLPSDAGARAGTVGGGDR